MKSRKLDSKKLLSRFVGRGGMTGVIAGHYIRNARNSAGYLKELQQQLKHNKQRMEQIWGKQLINDLERFDPQGR